MSLLGELHRAKTKVVEDGDCWIWVSTINWKGYGMFRAEGRSMKAHRWSYQTFVGPIPDGLVIDHTCANRACIKPDHLRAVTVQQNNLDRGWAAENARKVGCPNGHPYTHVARGSRRCAICERIADRNRLRKWRASRRAG